MSALLERYRRTGQRPTLAEKVRAETSLAELDAMQAHCGARGRELSDDERAAFALRRIELRAGNI